MSAAGSSVSNARSTSAVVAALRREMQDQLKEKERLQSEGKALYDAYTGKCDKLKDMSGRYQELKTLFVQQVRRLVAGTARDW